MIGSTKEWKRRERRDEDKPSLDIFICTAIRQSLVASRRFLSGVFRVFRGQSTEHTEYTEMVNGRPLIGAIPVKSFFCSPFFCPPSYPRVSAVPSFHSSSSSDSWL